MESLLRSPQPNLPSRTQRRMTPLRRLALRASASIGCSNSQSIAPSSPRCARCAASRAPRQPRTRCSSCRRTRPARAQECPSSVRELTTNQPGMFGTNRRKDVEKRGWSQVHRPDDGRARDDGIIGEHHCRREGTNAGRPDDGSVCGADEIDVGRVRCQRCVRVGVGRRRSDEDKRAAIGTVSWPSIS